MSPPTTGDLGPEGVPGGPQLVENPRPALVRQSVKRSLSLGLGVAVPRPLSNRRVVLTPVGEAVVTWELVLMAQGKLTY